MSDRETYKLTCYACGRVVELPASKADVPELRQCQHGAQPARETLYICQRETGMAVTI